MSDAQPQGDVGREYTMGNPVSLKNGKVISDTWRKMVSCGWRQKAQPFYQRGHERLRSVTLTTCCGPHKISEFILRATYKCGHVNREGGAWDHVHLKGIQKPSLFYKEKKWRWERLGDLPKITQLMRRQPGRWNPNRLIPFRVISIESSFCIVLPNIINNSVGLACRVVESGEVGSLATSSHKLWW